MAEYIDLKEYYATTGWQIKRQQRLELNQKIFGGWCERCGGLIGKNVHHRRYKNLGFEHPFDLEVLCDDCHSMLHPNNEDLKK